MIHLTQAQMGVYLSEIVASHSIEIKGNKLVGKKLINSSNYCNFIITFLKKGKLSLKIGSWTCRFDNETELISSLKEVAYIELGRPNIQNAIKKENKSKYLSIDEKLEVFYKNLEQEHANLVRFKQVAIKYLTKDQIKEIQKDIEKF